MQLASAIRSSCQNSHVETMAIKYDYHIPQDLFLFWKTHRVLYKHLNTSQIPRHVPNSVAFSSHIIHRFNDTSEKVYLSL